MRLLSNKTDLLQLMSESFLAFYSVDFVGVIFKFRLYFMRMYNGFVP